MKVKQDSNLARVASTESMMVITTSAFIVESQKVVKRHLEDVDKAGSREQKREEETRTRPHALACMECLDSDHGRCARCYPRKKQKTRGGKTTEGRKPQRRLTRLEKTQSSGGFSDLQSAPDQQQEQDVSRSSSCKGRESLRQDEQEDLFWHPPNNTESPSSWLHDRSFGGEPREIPPRHSTEDRHGETVAENNGRHLTTQTLGPIQDAQDEDPFEFRHLGIGDAHGAQDEDPFGFQHLGIDDAPSESSGVCRLDGDPREVTISVTEEEDQDKTQNVQHT